MATDPDLDLFVNAQVSGGLEAFVEAHVRKILAAGWNPSEHPRGPDGQFIETLGLKAAMDAAEDYFQRNRVFEAQDEMMAHGLRDDLNKMAEDFLIDQVNEPDSPIEDQDAALDAVLGKPDPENGLGLEQIQAEWKDNQYSSPAVKPMWEAASEAIERDVGLPPDSWFDGDVDTVDSPEDMEFAEHADEAVKAAFAFSQRYAEEYLADEDGKITVKRGIRDDLAEQALEAKEAGESLDVDPRALESWTLEENAAKYWADLGDEGAILTREIDVEDVALYAPAMIPEIQHQQEITTFGHDEYSIDPDQIEEFGGI